MELSLLLVVLVTFLPTPTLAHLTNHQLDLAQYAWQQAIENNINPKKFLCLLDKESQLNNSARGDWNPEEKVYKARGIAQFWHGTFEKMSDDYEFDGEYLNARDQIHLAAVAIGDGKWYHWKNTALACGFSKKNPT